MRRDGKVVKLKLTRPFDAATLEHIKLFGTPIEDLTIAYTPADPTELSFLKGFSRLRRLEILRIDLRGTRVKREVVEAFRRESPQAEVFSDFR